METRKLLGFSLAILLIGVCGGYYAGAVTAADGADKELDRWTDHLQAHEEGELAAYNAAIVRAANALDDLDEDALKTRLLAHVETLADEAERGSFLTAIMAYDCLRGLSWRKVSEKRLQHTALIGSNINSLKVVLDQESPRRQLQQELVRLDKELPLIREYGRALFDKVMTEVFGIKPIHSERERIREIMISLGAVDF